MAESEVRLAFVGCGGMSREHLRHWRALHHKGAAFTVAGAADAVEALAARHAADIAQWQGDSVPVFTDWRRMLEEVRPDAVDICTPHHLHHEVACACMEAGADVIVEKPLAVTVRAGRRMCDTAQRTGRVLAVAEQVRRWLGPRAVAWAVQGGPLGRPLLCSVQFVGGSRRNPDAQTQGERMPWRLDRDQAGGGVVVDIGVHYADFLLRCFGPVRRVTAQCARYADGPFADGRRPSVEDAANILLEFEGGVRAVWAHATSLAGQACHTNAYYGTGGSLVAGGLYPTSPRYVRWDHQESLEPAELVAAYLASLAAAERERLFPEWISQNPQAHRGSDLGIELELADFLEAVRTRRPVEVGGGEGLAAQGVAAAVLESAHAGGQPVQMAEVISGRIDAYQQPIDAALGLC